MIDDKTIRNLIGKKTPGAAKRGEPMKFIPDGAFPGLGLIVGALGRPSWTLAYRDPNTLGKDGKPKQIRTRIGLAWGGPGAAPSPMHLTCSAARARAYQIVEAAKAGIVTAPVKQAPAEKPLSFEDMFTRWLDTTRPKTRNQIEGIIGRNCQALLPRPIREITYHDTKPIIQAVKDRGSPIAARELFLFLRACFKWAVRHKLIAELPMVGDAPAKSKKRTRFLVDLELAKIWRASESSNPPLCAITKCLILTGQRVQEIASMRWSQIDEIEKTITFEPEDYKTDALHLIPLDSVWNIITSVPRIEASNFVFTLDGRKPVSMTKEATTLKQRVGFNNWQMRDLRRTARTNWANLEIDDHICELLIHPPTGVKGTYDRFRYLDKKREALATWRTYVDNNILRLVN